MRRNALLVAAGLAAGIWIGAAAPSQAAVEIVVHSAPPAAQVEVIPPAPSPGHYWIAGHWRWERGGWVWHRGVWIAARPGQVWVAPAWVRIGPNWHFREGHWAPIAAPREFVAVQTDVAPPPPRVEVVPAAPSAQSFWIPGYWRWDGRAHVWVTGHWELPHAGMIWVPAHWVHAGGHWHFRGGHWQPT